MNAALGAAASAVAAIRAALGLCSRSGVFFKRNSETGARFRQGRRLLGGGSFARVTDDGGRVLEL